RFFRAINRVRPSLIRIHADEVTYGMHVILRFELEQDMINGRVELAELPEIWNQRMYEYLGVEVPDDAQGVLQDVHWSSGLIGYFATYLLGTVMSVQIWHGLVADVPDVEEQIEGGAGISNDPRAHDRDVPPKGELRAGRVLGGAVSCAGPEKWPSG